VTGTVTGAGPVLTLVLTALAIMGSPGPVTVSLTAAGAAFGIRRSAGYLAGIVLGTSAVLVAVATGLTALLLSLPAVRPALLGVSAAYLLWLAYHLATGPAGASANARPPTLAAGALLGVANPKGWVAIAAVFGSARLAAGPAVDAAAKVAVIEAMIVLITTGWLLAGASLSTVLSHPRRARTVNVALALALLATTTAAALAG
jgi:threonine/homoserine/homoserine lactone efflux protein